MTGFFHTRERSDSINISTENAEVFENGYLEPQSAVEILSGMIRTNPTCQRPHISLLI